MSFGDDLAEKVSEFLSSRWDIRDGRKVPLPGDVQLVGEGVQVYGALLYADIANSTEMVESLKDSDSAEIYQSFVYCCCRIIRRQGGVITSFDGDRVMAAWVGQGCEHEAATAALMINGAVRSIINPLLAKVYKDNTMRLSHAVGVDASNLLVASTGMRDFNDLVWVGRAANYAAKMSGFRKYKTYITKRVHLKLSGEMGTGWTWVDWPSANMKILGSSDFIEV